MKLTKAGQFINLENNKVENVLDFDNGSFSLVISDLQYQSLLTFLQGAKRSMEQEKRKEDFYINEDQVQTGEEDGIDQL